MASLCCALAVLLLFAAAADVANANPSKKMPLGLRRDSESTLRHLVLLR